MYSAEIGRWMAADPADQFMSPYVGIGNDPVNGYDPDGRDMLLKKPDEGEKAKNEAEHPKGLGGTTISPYGYATKGKFQNPGNRSYSSGESVGDIVSRVWVNTPSNGFGYYNPNTGEEYYIDFDQLAIFNPNIDPNTLIASSDLNCNNINDPSKAYVVKEGDNLFRIAEAYGIDWASLYIYNYEKIKFEKNENGVYVPIIYVGMVLEIPTSPDELLESAQNLLDTQNELIETNQDVLDAINQSIELASQIDAANEQIRENNQKINKDTPIVVGQLFVDLIGFFLGKGFYTNAIGIKNKNFLPKPYDKDPDYEEER